MLEGANGTDALGLLRVIARRRQREMDPFWMLEWWDELHRRAGEMDNRPGLEGKIVAV